MENIKQELIETSAKNYASFLEKVIKFSSGDAATLIYMFTNEARRYALEPMEIIKEILNKNNNITAKQKEVVKTLFLDDISKSISIIDKECNKIIKKVVDITGGR